MEAYFVCGAAAKVSPCHSTFLFSYLALVVVVLAGELRSSTSSQGRKRDKINDTFDTNSIFLLFRF